MIPRPGLPPADSSPAHQRNHTAHSSDLPPCPITPCGPQACFQRRLRPCPLALLHAPHKQLQVIEMVCAALGPRHEVVNGEVAKRKHYPTAAEGVQHDVAGIAAGGDGAL